MPMDKSFIAHRISLIVSIAQLSYVHLLTPFNIHNDSKSLLLDLGYKFDELMKNTDELSIAFNAYIKVN